LFAICVAIKTTVCATIHSSTGCFNGLMFEGTDCSLAQQSPCHSAVSPPLLLEDLKAWQLDCSQHMDLSAFLIIITVLREQRVSNPKLLTMRPLPISCPPRVQRFRFRRPAWSPRIVARRGAVGLGTFFAFYRRYPPNYAATRGTSFPSLRRCLAGIRPITRPTSQAHGVHCVSSIPTSRDTRGTSEPFCPRQAQWRLRANSAFSGCVAIRHRNQALPWYYSSSRRGDVKTTLKQYRTGYY